MIDASRHAARSLAGLWLVHTNADAGADTSKAVSDLAMRGEPFLPAFEAIDRLVSHGRRASAERRRLSSAISCGSTPRRPWYGTAA